jgi:thioredoxin reductase
VAEFYSWKFEYSVKSVTMLIDRPTFKSAGYTMEQLKELHSDIYCVVDWNYDRIAHDKSELNMHNIQHVSTRRRLHRDGIGRTIWAGRMITIH